ncbi:uncharacterized protein Z518_03946 [Rhinocladiella mackenziei CBS 650.93]|uniref:Rhinocladiella mackenziei CBS 650.93 unplaced genomic scaffold supercont1.3, whole genome shotgun sequence n=1 Tax=Rhinocladiella mackenziei CBS 650.93 TaxID=1442369 RepID=A0A0D2FV58_9EURO|nr:uncharacterized protein Z518_03946 [Rhinocladiella mackenziei CBS 650.93]KIX05972.1 hypothetical protein Z518_03946 [Rhinocladiella mackenziei CBS 650.93]
MTRSTNKDHDLRPENPFRIGRVAPPAATQSYLASTYEPLSSSKETSLHTFLVAEEPKEQINLYKGYGNVHWYVDNTKQAAAY